MKSRLHGIIIDLNQQSQGLYMRMGVNQNKKFYKIQNFTQGQNEELHNSQSNNFKSKESIYRVYKYLFKNF